MQNGGEVQSLLNPGRDNSWEWPLYRDRFGLCQKIRWGKNEVSCNCTCDAPPSSLGANTFTAKACAHKLSNMTKPTSSTKSLHFSEATLSLLYTHQKIQPRYAKRSNFYHQLQIAKAKLNAGSMSKKDYISFNNSYLDAKLLK